MRKILVKLIELYQVMPIHTHNHCRFIPSCSEYMKYAITKYGSLKGTWLGIKRLLRCHPLGKYGYDPVKENL